MEKSVSFAFGSNVSPVLATSMAHEIFVIANKKNLIIRNNGEHSYHNRIHASLLLYYGSDAELRMKTQNKSGLFVAAQYCVCFTI